VDAALPPPPVLAAQQRARELEAAEAREAQQWRAQTDAVLSDLNSKLELVVARLEHPVQPPPPPPPQQPAVPSEPLPLTLPVEFEEQRQVIAGIAVQLVRIETEMKRSRRETKRLKTTVAEQGTAAAAAAATAVAAAMPVSPPIVGHTQVDMELFSDTVQHHVEEVIGRSERRTLRHLAEMEARLEDLLRRSPAPMSQSRHQQSSTVAPTRPVSQMPAPALPMPFAQPYGVSPAPPKGVKAEHRKRKARGGGGNSSQSDITQFRKALFRQLLTREQ
jgi:hypothetical protein